LLLFSPTEKNSNKIEKDLPKIKKIEISEKGLSCIEI